MGFKWIFRFFLVVVFTTTAFEKAFSQVKNQDEFYVIVNNNSFTKIDKKDLEDIFYGEILKWKDGERITVVFHSSDSPYLNKTADLFFNGSVLSLKKLWLSLVFQGRADIPPVFLSTDKEIVEYVNNNKGAIGIVYSKPNNVVNFISISP